MSAPPASSSFLVSLGDLAWDVLAKPDTPLLPGGDTTGRLELLGGGSAANFAVWARRVGQPTRFVGKVGRDRFGELAVAELQAEGVEPHVTWSAEHRTGVILALIDGRGQRAMLSGVGADWELLPQELPEAAISAARHLHLTAWSLFRDPPRAAAERAAGVAAGAGVGISLDPGSFQMIGQLGRGHFLDILDRIPFTMLFPNDDEAAAISGLREPDAMLDWLQARYPGVLVGLKLDARGALFGLPDGTRFHTPATPDPLVDATGAGDAFAGAFLGHYLRSADARAAAHCAAQMSGWVVSRFGARPPADADLLARIREATSGLEVPA